MSPFYAAPYALKRSLLEPVLGFFDVGQRARIRFTGVGASLEGAQPVTHNRQQHFVGKAIHPVAIHRNRPILKTDSSRRHITMAYLIFMAGITLSRSVEYSDSQRVVRGIDLVIVNFSHFTFSAASKVQLTCSFVDDGAEFFCGLMPAMR
jgi:hypothetical protein